MSKSKLNRRQLKKISKLAAEYVLRRHKHISVRQLLFDRNGEDQFQGEFGFWSIGDYDREYYSKPAIDYLVSDFYDQFTNWYEVGALDKQMKVSLPVWFYSQSFANKIHCMIRFLEVVNE